jgi:hypothetical protein
MVDWHAKGQKDGTRGKFDPPHGALDALFTTTPKKDKEDNDAYRSGYHNARKNR